MRKLVLCLVAICAIGLPLATSSQAKSKKCKKKHEKSGCVLTKGGYQYNLPPSTFVSVQALTKRQGGAQLSFSDPGQCGNAKLAPVILHKQIKIGSTITFSGTGGIGSQISGSLKATAKTMTVTLTTMIPQIHCGPVTKTYTLKRA